MDEVRSTQLFFNKVQNIGDTFFSCKNCADRHDDASLEDATFKPKKN